MPKKHSPLCCLVFSLLLAIGSVHARDSNRDSSTAAEYYGGITHQHHDFFGKVFSYSGLEGGVVLGRHFLAGAYGSSFVSQLEIRRGTIRELLNMWQSGLVLGVMTNDSALLHAGLLLNAGYISTTTTPAGAGDSRQSLSGLVVDPQVFGETNATRWLRLRAGVAYDLYALGNAPESTVAEIRKVSFNFGFLFGGFAKSRTWL